MQNFQVYKFFETVNNYYFYIISHIDDPDIVLVQFEHTSANKPNEPLYKYLNTAVGWDNIGIDKCDDIKPIDVINGVYGNDTKCMNFNNTFESLIPEKKKKEKAAKEPKPKKEPKPRSKKSNVKIDTVNTELNME